VNSALRPSASLAEQAYEVLEEKLVTLALPPGKQLSEGQLIEMTGFGRTPLREAVLRLAQQEFFLIMPRKGLVVTPVNRASMVLIIEARKPIERVIVYRAALNAMDTQRSEIAAIARKLTISHDSFEDFLKLDQELGNLLDKGAGNPYTSAAVSPMRGHCRRFWYHHRHQMQLSDAISAHSKMARLVARREYNGAQKASDGVIAVLERLVSSVDR
jgi:DNA-binding GntR family transcriptional regulator